MTSSTPWLRWQDLSFSWPGRHVLTGAHGALGPGLHWLQGANGAGKSTLLKLLAGVLRPSLGQAELLDAQGHWRRASPDNLDWKREVCWCGPGPLTFDHLSPRELLAWMATLYPRFQPAVVAELVPALALPPFMDQPLCTLSTGSQRKLALVAALAAGTRVRLIDEPFNALDPAAREVLALALRQLAPQAVWLVASHAWAGEHPPAQVLQVGDERVTAL